MQSAIVILLNAFIPILALFAARPHNPHEFAAPATHGNIGCVACHHPHQPTGRTPLWQDTAAGSQRFALYRSEGALPGDTSLMCLSCHDGSIADEVPVETGQPIVSQIGNSIAVVNEAIGAPLGSHPIGILYQPNRDSLAPPASVEARGIPLPKGRVECVSCHDPHGTTGQDYLLVKSNRRSALCLSCHQL